MDKKDLSSTLAGGALGAALIQQVRWELIPQPGELAKLATAFLLIWAGYLMYRPPPPPPVPTGQ